MAAPSAAMRALALEKATPARVLSMVIGLLVKT